MKKVILGLVVLASSLFASYYGIQVGAYNTDSYKMKTHKLDNAGLPYDVFETPDYKKKIIVGPFANISEAKESLVIVKSIAEPGAFIIDYTPKPTKKEGFVSIGIMGGTISPDATIYKDNIIPESTDQATYGFFMQFEFYKNYALEVTYSKADKSQVLFLASNSSTDWDGTVDTTLTMLDLNLKYYFHFSRYIIPYVKVGVTGYERKQDIIYYAPLSSLSVAKKSTGAKFNYGVGFESYLTNDTYMMVDYSAAHKRLNFGIATKLDY